MSVDAYEPGGVYPAVNAAPAPTKDTAGIEHASVADGAATAKPEALEPWVGGEAGREHDTALDKAVAAGVCGTDMAPCESPIDGEHVHDMVLQYSLTDGERVLGVLL